MSAKRAVSLLPPDLDDAILTLHAAIDRESLWEGVRGVLQRTCPCKRITLFLGHLGMGEARLVYTDPPIEDPVHWFDERGKINPFSPWIAANVGARLMRFSEVVGLPAAFRRTDFYREFAKPEGWDKGLSVMFWHGEEMRAMFSLYRGLRQPDFTDEEVERIMAMARHIEIAVIRVARIDREQNFRSALQAFTRTLPAPLLLLDWQTKLFFANTAAYESAARWNYGAEKAQSYNPRDCFVLPPPVMDGVQQLKGEIQAINPRELASRMPTPVQVEHPLETGFKATVSPVHFSRSSLARPGFYVLFQEPLLLDQPLPPEAIAAQKARALAVLTPAEREVVRHLCTGASNAQIAAARKKSVLTIKTQVNSIFSKLGIKSRAQLVARLK